MVALKQLKDLSLAYKPISYSWRSTHYFFLVLFPVVRLRRNYEYVKKGMAECCNLI